MRSGSAPVVAYVAACLALGAAAGLFWRLATRLPTWTVQDGGEAVISDEALTGMFEATARYVQLGAVGGLVAGLLALVLLRGRGWLIVAWALAGPLLAGLVAWGVGVLGRAPLEERLAQATVGFAVPVDLVLGAPVALLVWPLLAMLPVVIWSGFATDPDGSVRGADRRQRRTAEGDQVGRVDLELE